MNENQLATSRRPFLSAPDAARYFPGGAIEEARQKLTHNLQRSAGVALVIGGAGLGKSMLLEVLAAQFAGERTTLTLAGAQLCTRRALLQVILFQLGLPFRDLTEGELRLSILSHLKQQSAKSGNATAGQLLLLVDEAESLPVRLLEELRVLTNVAHAGMPLVDLVLAGGPSLEERFTEPELETFNQRVTLRCYVAPLGREETFQYVRSQVAASGGNPAELFAQDGLEAIYSATDGIPRLVNQLGDRLAWMAEQTDYQPIDAPLVQQAWAELQQLPAPWNMDDGPPANRTPQPHCFANETSAQFGQRGALDGSDDPIERGALGENELGENIVEFGELDDASVLEIGGVNAEPCQISGQVDSQPELESKLEDGSDDGDDEDAMPASIPFGASPAATALAAYDDCSDATIDATEKLLAELGEIGGGDALLAPHDATSHDATSHASSWHEAATSASGAAETADDGVDPFGGGFDEEEVVIDPYASFEAEMLSFAPDVMNSLDVGFAEGLNRVTPHQSRAEAHKPALSAVVCDELIDVVCDEPTDAVCDEPAAEKRFDEEPIEPTELDLEEVAEIEETPVAAAVEEPLEESLPAEQNIAMEPAELSLDDCFGAFDEEESTLSTTAYFEQQELPRQPMPTVSANKILVLEDDGRGLAEVVPGRQFRRLFSGLEAGS